MKTFFSRNSNKDILSYVFKCSEIYTLRNPFSWINQSINISFLYEQANIYAGRTK